MYLIVQMLTGGTSKEDQNEIYRRMEQGEGDGEKVIRVSRDLSDPSNPSKIVVANTISSVT